MRDSRASCRRVERRIRGKLRVELVARGSRLVINRCALFADDATQMVKEVGVISVQLLHAEHARFGILKHKQIRYCLKVNQHEVWAKF